jgi:hypothetical protein
MKTFLILFISPLLIFGQKNAFWETKLFFEDGIGNKDSISIGHDLISNGDFNPEFGEINIKEVPWNSVFEARASHNEGANGHASPKVLSKKIIGSTEAGLHPTYGCLFVREPIKFFVKIKNFPLKISWNSEDHNDFCNIKNFITPHILPQVLPGWHKDTAGLANPIKYACLANENHYTINNFSKVDNDFFEFLLEPNSNGSFDTIHGFYLSFKTQSSSFSPCSGTVDVLDLIKQDLQLTTFPNPTTNFINLESTEFLTWELFDIHGKLIKWGRELMIDIQDLNDGIYFLKVRIKDKIVTKKIIKNG